MVGSSEGVSVATGETVISIARWYDSNKQVAETAQDVAYGLKTATLSSAYLY